MQKCPRPVNPPFEYSGNFRAAARRSSCGDPLEIASAPPWGKSRASPRKDTVTRSIYGRVNGYLSSLGFYGLPLKKGRAGAGFFHIMAKPARRCQAERAGLYDSYSILQNLTQNEMRRNPLCIKAFRNTLVSKSRCEGIKKSLGWYQKVARVVSKSRWLERGPSFFLLATCPGVVRLELIPRLCPHYNR